MSYRFYPPRTTNFFPPGVPYLSGLGDYASDLATYEKAQSRYLTLLAAFNKAMTEFTAACALIDQQNAGYARSYQEQLARYNTEYARIKAANSAAAQKIASAYGFTLPQSFIDGGACISPAQRDAFARNCQTVKGLMGLGMRGLGSADPDCGWKLMPVCNYPVRPVAPVRKLYPPKPTPPVAPARPTPPVTTTPLTSGGGNGGNSDGGNPNSGGGPLVTTTPTPTVTTDDSDDTKKSGMIRNGIIVAVVIGGGYLVYRTIKKPKAAA